MKSAPANLPIDREKQKELQKQKRRLSNLEIELDKLKQEKIKLETALGDPSNYSDPTKFQQLEASYKQIQSKWTTLNQE
ncbi:ABC transporter C-terminal domain-containing protein, partial [Parvimonas sp. M13]|uniref:ABC transporter C-terminal domain-containing protein n=1 Tax=Parvimonas sp. M13 TaxID=3110694 RepID=UPI003A7F2D28